MFLQDGNGLVLRALHGLVEDMIEFIASTESSHLLGLAHVHKSAENSPLNWMSAPIVCGVQAKGAVVVARTDANDSPTLSFLEKTAFRIGHLLEGSALATLYCRLWKRSPIWRTVLSKNRNSRCNWKSWPRQISFLAKRSLSASPPGREAAPVRPL